MDHTLWAAPPSSTEQSALNLTQTEPLEMMSARHRRDVWEFYMTSRVHRAPVLSTIQSVFEGTHRHTGLEDPLHRAGFMISVFFPGKNQWLDTSLPKLWHCYCSGVSGAVRCIPTAMENPPFNEMGPQPGPQPGLVWSCCCHGGFCNNCIIKHFYKRVMNSGRE